MSDAVITYEVKEIVQRIETTVNRLSEDVAVLKADKENRVRKQDRIRNAVIAVATVLSATATAIGAAHS